MFLGDTLSLKKQMKQSIHEAKLGTAIIKMLAPKFEGTL